MSERKCENWLDSYIEYTAKLESPLNYHIWCGLSVVASVLQRRLWVDMGYFKVFPNMYVVLVGAPGRCRKGIAINSAINLVTDMSEVKISADSITREALIQAIKLSESMVDIGGKPVPQSALTIVSKELSVFLGTGNHDLLSLLTDLYDCHDKWEYRTKNKGIDTIYGVWLNMLGASTPTWLVGSIPLTAIGGGFTSRVIFVVEDDVRHKNPRPKLTEKELRLKSDLITDLEKMFSMKGEMILSENADEYLADWYINYKSPLADNPKFGGYVERKQLHVLKIATLLSACESNETVIHRRHIAKALDLLNSIEGKMVRAFGAVGRSPVAADIDDVLNVVRGAEKIEFGQLLTSVQYDVDIRGIDAILMALLQMGLIRVELSTTQPGKKFIVYTGPKEN